jgi:cytoskeletal protein RodZ
MHLAQALRGYRKKAGLSLEETGEKVRLQQKIISTLE